MYDYLQKNNTLISRLQRNSAYLEKKETNIMKKIKLNLFFSLYFNQLYPS